MLVKGEEGHLLPCLKLGRGRGFARVQKVETWQRVKSHCSNLPRVEKSRGVQYDAGKGVSPRVSVSYWGCTSWTNGFAVKMQCWRSFRSRD